MFYILDDISNSISISYSYLIFIISSLTICLFLEIKELRSRKAIFSLLLFSLFLTNIVPLYLLVSSENPFQFNFVLYPEYINKSAGLVSMFIISLMIGQISSQKKIISASKINFRNEFRLSQLGKKVFLFLSMICALGFIATAGSSFWSASVYREGLEYGQTFDNGIAGNFRFLFSIFFAIYIYFIISLASLNILNKSDNIAQITILNQIKKKDYFSIACLLIYSCLYLIGGDRGAFLLSILTIFAAYTLLAKKINFTKIILASLVGAVFMKYLTFYRSGSDADLIIVYDLVMDDGIFLLFEELYGSFIHIQTALHISETEGFQYGALWVSSLLSVFPLLVRFLNSNNLMPEYTESATYFTNYILKGDVHTGLGTNLIADIYINIGLFGLVIFGLLIGYLYGYLTRGMLGEENKIMTSNFLINKKYRIVIFLIFTSGFFYLPRAGVFHEFKAICWGLLLMFLYRIIARKIVINK